MLTVCLTTLRKEPRFSLLVESLLVSAAKHTDVAWEFLVIDGLLWYDEAARRDELTEIIHGRFPHRHLVPKPSVWQGPTRLTTKDYWDACSARNTALCYAKGKQIVFIDDCFEVSEDWLAGHARGARLGAIYVGPFRDAGHTCEECDHRIKDCPSLRPCSPGWTYGMNMGVPIEASFEINGYDEAYSGQAGVEDIDFGLRLGRRLVEAWFNPKIFVTQHRETHQDVCRFKPKERKLRDGKMHYSNEFLIQRLFDEPSRYTTLDRRHSLMQLRWLANSGRPFPVPTMPDRDWRDGQNLSEM
jgi:hypothetical protein